MRTKLIECRKSLGMTQASLAEAIEVSEVYIRKLESGDRNPSIKLMMKFEKLFGVPIKELFSDIFFETNDTKCIKK